LLIEDSAFMRILLSDYLKSDPEVELIAVGNNGKDGFEKTKMHRPDVVVTDMVMPDFDGLYGIKNIMKECPTPIIVLSSLDKTNPQIFDALKAGALEFVDKPKSDIQGTFKGGGYELLNLIKSFADIDDITQKSANLLEVTHQHTFSSQLEYDIIAIGASTGGPGATESIITRLPGNLAIPVVIAQHMPPRFLVSYAERLDKLTPLRVKIPNAGEELKPGYVYVAPGNTNTRVMIQAGKPIFRFTSKKYKEFNEPSVDCLFESVGDAYGKKAIGVILTGMGRDGTLGLKRIKSLGGRVISQDEASAVVYGMPKSAYDAGVVDQIVKLRDIPGYIVSCL